MLILDEPTNHLDIDSREALEDALQSFPGSLLLVSHDRALLEAVGTRTVAIADYTLKSFVGGWQEYWAGARSRSSSARIPATPAPQGAAGRPPDARPDTPSPRSSPRTPRRRNSSWRRRSRQPRRPWSGSRRSSPTRRPGPPSTSPPRTRRGTPRPSGPSRRPTPPSRSTWPIRHVNAAFTSLSQRSGAGMVMMPPMSRLSQVFMPKDREFFDLFEEAPPTWSAAPTSSTRCCAATPSRRTSLGTSSSASRTGTGSPTTSSTG